MGMIVGLYICDIQLQKYEQIEKEVIYKRFNDTLTESNVMYVLDMFDVQHKDIVLSQALLETGNFKSNICINYNNIFGLYDSAKGDYYHYSHWIASVLAYKWKVQRKYKGGCYYDFLERIGYAEDPNYINKLKQFHN